MDFIDMKNKEKVYFKKPIIDDELTDYENLRYISSMKNAWRVEELLLNHIVFFY